MVELLRAVAPGLPVHGSTQMSITSPEGAEFARRVRAPPPRPGCRAPALRLPTAPVDEAAQQDWQSAACRQQWVTRGRRPRVPPDRPQLGVSRVVVGRELSIRDISQVSAGSGAEVEVRRVCAVGLQRGWVGLQGALP